MKLDTLTYQQTNFFTKTVIDFLKGDAKLQDFFGNTPDIKGFKNQIQQKKKQNLSKSDRKILVESLKKQYQNTTASKKTQQHIDALLQPNTFTITTGHQLNLFTGPLYFLYKIISVINLCDILKKEFPEDNFVPIYWMATEDHDFEEINYFNFFGKKIKWKSGQKGAVGRFSTEGLATVFEQFSTTLDDSIHAGFLKQLFSKAYLKHENLAAATRFIANTLFSDYGLVVLDGDAANLKRLFVPFVKDELINQTSYKEVSKTIESLKENYKIQVNPREINLFYLKGSLRERIVKKGTSFEVLNTSISFSETEIISELEKHPERFSPNVLLRPLYQEVILPNLCYIGGGGELAYWLELKAYFEAVNVVFPVVMLRNSVQIISEKQARKLAALQITFPELFLKQHQLIATKVKQNSDVSFDFKQQRHFLEQQFNTLKVLAKKTDKSFVGAVHAQEKKQLNGLNNLEKRLLRAEKRKQKELVDRIVSLQEQLFPNQSLEERQRNFSEFYLDYGPTFIQILKQQLQPLQLEFTILTL